MAGRLFISKRKAKMNSNSMLSGLTIFYGTIF